VRSHSVLPGPDGTEERHAGPDVALPRDVRSAAVEYRPPFTGGARFMAERGGRPTMPFRERASFRLALQSRIPTSLQPTSRAVRLPSEASQLALDFPTRTGEAQSCVSDLNAAERPPASA
jgi:hypothetical protein